MERNLKLVFGLIGGLVLIFINRIFSGHDFLGGIFGYILNGVMQGLSFIGLIMVEIISVLLFIDTMKFILKKHTD